jgi:hypothetical protein
MFNPKQILTDGNNKSFSILFQFYEKFQLQRLVPEDEECFSLRDIISCFIYVCLLLSFFSINYFVYFESYIIEIPIILSILYSIGFSNSFEKSFRESFLLYRETSLVPFTIICVVAAIGVTITKNIFWVYADFRANTIILVAFFYTKYLLENKKLKLLFYLSFMSSLLFAIHWIYLYLGDKNEIKFHSPMIGAVLACIIATRLGSFLKITISFLLILFLAAISFYRQYWIYVIITPIICFLPIISYNGKSRATLIKSFVLIMIISIVASGFIINLYNSDESSYIQSIGKFYDLVGLSDGSNTITDSDALRVGYFEYIWNNIPHLILPHGLGSKYYFDNLGEWFKQFGVEANTIDSLYFYIVFHYGILVLAGLIIYIFKGLSVIKNKFDILSIIIIFSPILSMLLFDGGSATVIPRAYWLGAYFAFFIVEKNKIISNVL